MKRAVAAIAGLGLSLGLAIPASAAGTNAYGSAKVTYQVNATAQLGLITQYTAKAQGSAIPTAANILESGTGTPGTNCGIGGVAEVANTISFAGINPGSSSTNYQGCYYKNAIAIATSSNDSAGYKVYQYLDGALPTGFALCSKQNDTTPAATPTASGAAAGTNPAAYSGSCPAAAPTQISTVGGATAGTGPGAVSTVTLGGTGTANATPYYAALPGALPTPWLSTTTLQAGTAWAGEDIQLNVSGSAASNTSLQNFSIVVAIVPN